MQGGGLNLSIASPACNVKTCLGFACLDLLSKSGGCDHPQFNQLMIMMIYLLKQLSKLRNKAELIKVGHPQRCFPKDVGHCRFGKYPRNINDYMKHISERESGKQYYYVSSLCMRTNAAMCTSTALNHAASYSWGDGAKLLSEQDTLSKHGNPSGLSDLSTHCTAFLRHATTHCRCVLQATTDAKVSEGVVFWSSPLGASNFECST